VAAGALGVAAAGLALGRLGAGALAGVAAPAIGLLFLLLTTALLVADLKRPERFLYLLVKPNWRSWLVWGGWILLATGGAGTLWLWAALGGDGAPPAAVLLPGGLLAAAAAGYSAFLFGQAEGRDFWQSPLLLPQLLVAAVLAGSAALLLVADMVGSPAGEAAWLRLVLLGALAAALLVLLAELLGRHPGHDAARAAGLLARGALAGPLWGGVVGAGLLLPGLLLLTPWWPLWLLAAALALAGLWLYEELWMRAGQALPLS
jgi:formate-dependent nitrite reductase membrane component NrfD